ncbi:disintegrin and metalloproteinase domain-containing protein 2-like [Tenrec ecaudatus]|uniref:disintegrin and metalloproteinase domain-containing protein 2-like n=1 Tax=Tenrec ecaudatus TaxID=94439 RepID=UPI003F5A033E
MAIVSTQYGSQACFEELNSRNDQFGNCGLSPRGFIPCTFATFLPNNFRVYGYNGGRSVNSLDQRYQKFCYYQGFIEGFPNSMAIISTCTGLRGLLQFDNVSYGIEPLESSIGFEHVIYQVKHKNDGVSLYAEKDIESRALPYKIQSIEPESDFYQYIEMHIVVEKQLYNHMGADSGVVTEKMFELIGLANAMFTSFNVTIILSSLEFWIDENKISTAGGANDILHRFLIWKQSFLVLRPHDVAFFLLYREHINYIGATFQGKMCDRSYGGSVLMHPKTISLESLAVIMVQLLSLSMGISYDDKSKCQCPGAVCIMSPEAIHSSGVKSFSNCSMEDFARFFSKPTSQCLQNHPRFDPSYKTATCGNGEIEEGEQCDCGSAESCADGLGICCNPQRCTLTDTSVCGRGDCCSNCQFKAKGEVCRASVDDCDLTEYCNGTSSECQEDLYVQNGHRCENTWICLNGRCMNGSKQCTMIFGDDTSFASDNCFKEINSRKDQSGNCGSSGGQYTPCATGDLKCGKLICSYSKRNVIKIQNATVLYSNVKGEICVTVDYDGNQTNSNMMWVKEGTICAKNKVCKNMKCVESTYLKYDCDVTKCNNQGVCNNKKNCHCNPTYLPPNCQNVDQTWLGGSVDSGNFPPTANAITPGNRYINIDYSTKPTRWPYFLLIPFFIILGILIAILVKVTRQRKKWRSEEYTSDEQLESEGETKE